ncbi:GNAT family N-acetyltransferase [Agrococcus carbonis]|uniref:Acetyltransferase (GNAT) family protein n=1 Tax=Agrococcus carbonis TaxID=684552 RepID=A0A1H1L9L6_9MICO|nr:GNAT family N-acetyltransferase [Agrococcus carbonis]SDR71196.1 Acetyltransferase (GNAT) family protein [Agrococcus carbonis]
MSAPRLEWLELETPDDDFDEPRLSLVARYVAAANRVTQHHWGDDAFDTTVDEIVASLRHPDDEIARRFLVTEGGRDVGRAIAAINREEGSRVAYVSAWVVPDERGRGIGRAMAERLEAVGRELGATTLQGWVDHRVPAEGEAGLRPASGHGAIAVDAPTRLATSLGYALEQVDRISELDVEAARADLERHRADALAHAGDVYEARSWQGATPPELQDAMAALRARMATDAPSAGLDVDDEQWDAARVQRLEEEVTGSGRTLLQAVAIHRDSGEAVAFTVLVLPDAGRPAFQEDTLVRADHRGHRLGMLVKTENLLQLGRLHPDRTRVITWNASENRPMLAVNEALGFVAVGAEGAWQKRLAPVQGAGADGAAEA